MVTRIDKSTTSAVRAARRAEGYVSSAFQLLSETTDAGNAKLVAQAADDRKDFESRVAQVRTCPKRPG
jgi:methyl-accepting chemotaxis protein